MPVTLKPMRLLGRDYAAHEDIAAEVWARVPETNRRALVATKMVGPDMVPAPTASGKRRRAAPVPSQP